MNIIFFLICRNLGRSYTYNKNLSCLHLTVSTRTSWYLFQSFPSVLFAVIGWFLEGIDIRKTHWPRICRCLQWMSKHIHFVIHVKINFSPCNRSLLIYFLCNSGQYMESLHCSMQQSAILWFFSNVMQIKPKNLYSQSYRKRTVS